MHIMNGWDCAGQRSMTWILATELSLGFFFVFSIVRPVNALTGWCPFLGGLGSWKLEQEGSIYQAGFNLAGGEGSHARDESSELLAKMM